MKPKRSPDISSKRVWKIIWHWVGYACIIGFFVAYLFPLFWLFLTAFKRTYDAFAIPPVWFFKPTLQHYVNLFSDASGASGDHFFKYLMNSVIITGISTTVSIAIACYAGYALARIRPKGSRIIEMSILGIRLFPPVSLIVPLFVIFHRLNLLDTRTALILPYTALNIPLATWMMRGFFIELPKELEDAAFVDGCTRWSAFHRIIMPLVVPALAATGVFSFILGWNDLMFAVALSSFEAPTLPILASRVRAEEGIMWGRLGAVSLIITIPTAIFVCFTQKWLVKGLTAGAVKQ